MANLQTPPHHPHLTVTVDDAGEARIDFHHFPGKTCLDMGRQLHLLLAEFGVVVAESQVTLKPEAFQAPAWPVTQDLSLPMQEGVSADGR